MSENRAVVEQTRDPRFNEHRLHLDVRLEQLTALGPMIVAAGECLAASDDPAEVLESMLWEFCGQNEEKRAMLTPWFQSMAGMVVQNREINRKRAAEQAELQAQVEREAVAKRERDKRAEEDARFGARLREEQEFDAWKQRKQETQPA